MLNESFSSFWFYKGNCPLLCFEFKIKLFHRNAVFATTNKRNLIIAQHNYNFLPFYSEKKTFAFKVADTGMACVKCTTVNLFKMKIKCTSGINSQEIRYYTGINKNSEKGREPYWEIMRLVRICTNAQTQRK